MPIKQKLTEFEIQAEAYFRLKQVYSNVRGEYRLKDTYSKRYGIADLVILNNQEFPILIIEIKRALKRPSRTNQCQRYEDISGCPAILIQGMEEAINVVQIVKEHMEVLNGMD